MIKNISLSEFTFVTFLYKLNKKIKNEIENNKIVDCARNEENIIG